MTIGTRGVAAYSAQSYSSLERIATAVRARLLPHLADDAPVPGLRLFERLDDEQVVVRGCSIPLQYSVEELAPGLEAQAYYSVEERAIVVALSPATYDDLRMGRGRALFTVAHEIGHAVLHAAELIDRRLAAAQQWALHRGETRDHKAFMDTEWQANGFAAAMLMPGSGLVRLELAGSLSARSVASTFHVSAQAAQLRLNAFANRRQELLGR